MEGQGTSQNGPISGPNVNLSASGSTSVSTPSTDSSAQLAPDKSKLPAVERKPDHLNTIVTTLCVVTFLPIPLLLAFGPKAFLWMGIVIFVVALIRLINSPVQLERPARPISDPVTAALRQRQASKDGSISPAAGTQSR